MQLQILGLSDSDKVSFIFNPTQGCLLPKSFESLTKSVSFFLNLSYSFKFSLLIGLSLKDSEQDDIKISNRS